MNDSQPPVSPRQRLQALLAIPERQRTEAEWDELNELEIMLAPGNREGAPNPNNNNNNNMRRNGMPQPGQQGNKPGGGPNGKKPMKKFHKRRPRGNAP
jgi:hypothetical protein